jgi:DNA ligase (NAD+)
VIPGSTRVFENRDALKAFLEGKGGKVTGSVSAKTDALINNEKASSSTKNKAAKSMGIPIITEEELLEFIEKEEVSGGEEDSSRDSTESVAEGETQQSFL